MKTTCVIAAAIALIAVESRLYGQEPRAIGSSTVREVEAPAGTLDVAPPEGGLPFAPPEGGMICAANGFAVPVPLTSYEAARAGSFNSWIFRRYAGSVEMQEKVYYPPGYSGWYYFRPWKPDWIYPLPPSPVREEYESYPTMPPHGATLNGLHQPTPAAWGAARALPKTRSKQYR